MALELIDSAFMPALLPGQWVFTCQWEHDGVTCSSVSLVDNPAMLASPAYWEYQHDGMVHWFKSHKRKHGEIACIPT